VTLSVFVDDVAVVVVFWFCAKVCLAFLADELTSARQSTMAVKYNVENFIGRIREVITHSLISRHIVTLMIILIESVFYAPFRAVFDALLDVHNHNVAWTCSKSKNAQDVSYSRILCVSVGLDVHSFDSFYGSVFK
jgi:hypothetical protein